MKTIHDIFTEEEVIFYNKMFILLDVNEDFGMDFEEINRYSVSDLFFIKDNISKFVKMLDVISDSKEILTYYKPHDLPLIQLEDRWATTKGKLNLLINLEIAQAFVYEIQVFRFKQKEADMRAQEEKALNSLY